MSSLSIQPANQVPCEDLFAVFGTAGYTALCFCQRFKLTGRDWWETQTPVEERMFRLRQQTDCGYPDSTETTGLVSYLDGEPVGWCSVEPRSNYARLGQTPWKGRNEDRSDDSIWAVACLVTRTGFRGQGLTYPLAAAAVDFARERGAVALEGYPMINSPGETITWGEMHVGARSVFSAVGFNEVHRPSKRRVVMRVDF